MTKTYYRILVMFCLLFSANLAVSQEPTLALLDSPDVQSQSDEAATGLLVDRSLKSSSYPSMEQEMRMYVELMKEEPKAFFFPNPSKGVVWIEHNLGESCRMTLTDSEGNVIFRAADLKTKKLNLTEFPPGLYKITLSNAEASLTETLRVR